MPQGVVKAWLSDRGFGFIAQEDGPDVFCHHTSILADGFRSLKEGERVEFEVAVDPRGRAKATIVRRLDDAQ
jgi:cold shock protein